LRAASYAVVGGACLGIGAVIGCSWTIKAVSAL
jgi:hypothetical protein